MDGCKLQPTVCLTAEVLVVVHSDVKQAEKEEKKKRQLASALDSVVTPGDAIFRATTLLQGCPGEYPAAAKKRSQRALGA